MKTPIYLTDAQHRILLESRNLGHTSIYGAQVKAARILQSKGLGVFTWSPGTAHFFHINEAGRKRVS